MVPDVELALLLDEVPLLDESLEAAGFAAELSLLDESDFVAELSENAAAVPVPLAEPELESFGREA